MLTVQVQKKQSVQSLELRQSPRISTPKIPVCPTSPSQKCRTHASAEPSEASTIFVRRSHHSITTVAILDPVPVVAEATCRETWEKANFPKKSKTEMTETEKAKMQRVLQCVLHHVSGGSSRDTSGDTSSSPESRSMSRMKSTERELSWTLAFDGCENGPIAWHWWKLKWDKWPKEGYMFSHLSLSDSNRIHIKNFLNGDHMRIICHTIVIRFFQSELCRFHSIRWNSLGDFALVFWESKWTFSTFFSP